MITLDEVKSLIPHQSLEAYAFPIVVRAFKKYGVPSSLSKIDSKRAGALAVTLASEIAIVTSVLLTEAIRRVPNLRKYKELDHLPEPISPAVTKQFEDARAQCKFAYRAVLELEKEINDWLPENVTVFFGDVGSLRNRDVLRREIAKISEDFIHKRQCEVLARRYEGRCLRLDEANLQYDRARAFSSETVTSTAQASEIDPAQKESHQKLADVVEINFGSHAGILDEGCIDLLRRHDTGWWLSISAFIESEVNRNIKSNPVKFLVRHPETLEAVKAVLKALENPETADEAVRKRQRDYNSMSPADFLLTMLEQESIANFQLEADWFNDPSAGEKFKTLRASLRQDDLMCQEWIQETGGIDHPYDIFTPKKTVSVLRQKEEMKHELHALLSVPAAAKAGQIKYPKFG
jgi:hypothetical protein